MMLYLCHVCTGHRVQHEFEFLWEFHKKHHSIDTPTAASAVFIHPIDSTLQVPVVPGLCAASIKDCRLFNPHM